MYIGMVDVVNAHRTADSAGWREDVPETAPEKQALPLLRWLRLFHQDRKDVLPN